MIKLFTKPLSLYWGDSRSRGFAINRTGITIWRRGCRDTFAILFWPCGIYRATLGEGGRFVQRHWSMGGR